MPKPRGNNPFKSEKIKEQVVRSFEHVLQSFVQANLRGVVVGVLATRLSGDYSYLDIYISIYPEEKKIEVLEILNQSLPRISHTWVTTTAKRFRKIPTVRLFLDDTLDHMDAVNQLFESDL